MSIGTTNIGGISASKLILGGNPFSGVSHLGIDLEMKLYYTTQRIKEHLKQAEQLGITTFIGRCDNHITRVLLEYWDEGGTIQWIAQSCPERANFAQTMKNAVQAGAKACFVHGGHIDSLYANNKTDEIPDLIKALKDLGVPAGIAGHNPKVFDWAEEKLNTDFYMCCYYNPIDRAKRADYIPGTSEKYMDEDREIMINTISKIKRPVIHYKVLAAGRKDPIEAFEYACKHLKPKDAICFGVYTKNKPNMIKEDVGIFIKAQKTIGI